MAATLAATAQDSQEPAWYQVEVIVFSQQDNYGDENNRTDIELGYPDKQVFLKDREDLDEPSTVSPSPGQQQAGEAEPRAPLPEDVGEQNQGPTPFLRLPEKARELNADAYSLNRTGVYKVLYHEAWRQPATGREGPWVIVAGGRVFGDHRELEGSLRLYETRHLHFQASLWRAHFSDPVTGPGGDAADDQWPGLPEVPEPPPETPVEEPADRALTIGEERTRSASAVGSPSVVPEAESRVRHEILDIDRLRQSRRIETGKLHYFDHPRLGVIVKVTAFEPEPPDSEETRSLPAAGDQPEE
jgi:hypothetical protein